MISDIEAGKVGIVLVKDLSRVGRDYLRVGFYTEVTFPQNGVRFIAVNNGVDSANQSENDFAPFLNIMNIFTLVIPPRRSAPSIGQRATRANTPAIIPSTGI